jgi:hypothetical protein
VKVFSPFLKENAYSFEPESIDERGKAHGLYGYSFPGLRKLPAGQRPGKTVSKKNMGRPKEIPNNTADFLSIRSNVD